MTRLTGLKILILPFLCLAGIGVCAQQLTWAHRIGSPGLDESNSVAVNASGDVYIAGKFSGANVDFDPSSADFLMSSNGQTDAFVAKYNSAGQFISAFSFGGSGLDEVNFVTVDGSGNILITGYFRGPDVDFDPGPASQLLTSNGEGGGDPGYGGDIFVAKYNSSGVYQWAFNMGGTLLGDNGLSVKTNPAGEVYVGGYFRESVDFDPGPGTTLLNSADGPMFLAKYTAGGAFLWAFNAGQGNVDNTPFDLFVDAAGNCYSTGFYQGTNMDFDPGPGTAFLNSNGGFEMFVSKYNTNGEYQLAFSIGSWGTDVGRGIVADAAGNIYVICDFSNSSVDFDPGPGTQFFSSAGAGDVGLAKYNSMGEYQWAFSFGGVANDFGWQVATDGDHLFITGGFNGSPDMDPSPTATETLTSSGGYDIFMGKYSLDGEYLCSFKIGSTDDDFGYSLISPAPNVLYLTGSFQGSSDFDPSTAVTSLTSVGSPDAFIAKYSWPDNNSSPAGTISGNNACGEEIARLTFHSSSGQAPFNIRYSDGVTEFLQEGVLDGVPFEIVPQPTTTTTYTLIAVRDDQRCSESNYIPGNAVTILVDRTKVIAGDLSEVCQGNTIQLAASGSQTYSWSPAAGLSDPNIADPSLIAANNTRYYVTGIGLTGCPTIDSVDVALFPAGSLQSSTDTSVCNSLPILLHTSGGSQYTWSPAINLNDPSLADPIFSPGTTTEFFIDALDGNGCGVRDSVTVSVFPAAIITAGNVQTCAGVEVQLTASGVASYSWFPATGLDNASVAAPEATTDADITYTVTGIDSNGCRASSAAFIDVYDRPVMTLTGDTAICTGKSVSLLATGGLIHLWTPSAGLSDPSSDNPVATPLTTTTYFVQTTDQHSCIYRDSVQVRLFQDFNLTLTRDTAVCILSPLRLLASGAQIYSWFPVADLTGSTTANPVLTAAASAEIFVTGTDANGCSKMDSVFVEIYPDPEVSASADASACFKASVQLNSSGAADYSWFPSVGLSNPILPNPVAVVDSSIQYIVTGTDVRGCSASDTVDVSMYPVPIMTLNPDTTICHDRSIQLHVTGGVSYVWTPGLTLSDATIPDPIASPDSTTVYHVYTTDQNNCIYSDSVIIELSPRPVFTINGPLVLCEKDSVTLLATGGDEYLWSPAISLSDPAVSDPTASPSTSIIYSVNIHENACDNTATLSAAITVRPLPHLVLTKERDVDCSYGSSQLTATGASSYIWLPAESLSNSFVRNPVASPRSTTTYTVTATDAAGCISQDSISVAFDHSNSGQYLMPTAFSPNNDGVNDCFGIGLWGLIDNIQFSIFNRWGERIFYTEDGSRCWDGTYKGIRQPGDVYVYMIRGSTVCNPTVFRKGTFVLIR